MHEEEKGTQIKNKGKKRVKGKGWLYLLIGILVGILLTVVAMEIYTKEIAPLDMRDYENTDILIASDKQSPTSSFERFYYSPELSDGNNRFLQHSDFKDDDKMLISGDLFS